MRAGRGGWKRLRRWLGGLAVLLPATVLAAMALVSWKARSRQLGIAPVVSGWDQDEAAAERLAGALRIQTTSYADRSQMQVESFVELHDYLARQFPQVHADPSRLRREVVNQMSLLYHWPGSRPELEPILLMSHLDVVPVNRQTIGAWDVKPEEARIWTDAEGTRYVYGRGALDVKCGALAMLEAAEHRIGEDFQPERSIYFALGHDEEVGGDKGNAEIARRLGQEGRRFEFLLDEGGAILDGVIAGVTKPVAFVAIAEKGVGTLKLTARGQESHGSMDPAGSAVYRMTAALERIRAHPMPARLDAGTASLLDYLGPEMTGLERLVVTNRWLTRPLVIRSLSRQPSTNATIRTILNPTIVRAGEVTNITPERATVQFDVRLLPGDTMEDVVRHVTGVTRDLNETGSASAAQPPVRFEVIRQKLPPRPARLDAPPFQALQRTIHEVFPDVVVAPGVTAVSTDSWHYRELTDHLLRFIPMRLTGEDLKRLHGVNERIAVRNYGEVVRFYIRLIRNCAG